MPTNILLSENLKGALRIDEEDRINVYIRDDGVGLPKSPEKLGTGSLGMTLIKKFTKQLKADISIKTQKDQGISFNLVLQN